jgi:hypothetical protein
MDEEYCIALRAPDGRLGDHDAGRVDAEVVAAVNQARHAVHQEMVALRGCDVEDNVPTLAGLVTSPVIVADHHFAVLGVTAGGHEGAAMVGRDRSLGQVVEFGIPFIEVRHFQPGVERHHIPHVQLYTARGRAIGDALQLRAVFGFHVGP